MNILVFNVGSTTLKYACIDVGSGVRLTAGTIDRIGQPGGDAADHLSAAQKTLAEHRSIDVAAIGHRIVMGGAIFDAPTLVDDAVIAKLRTLDTLAPLHNPSARSVVEAIDAMQPNVPQTLVFDTAFFASLPPKAYRYAVPESIYIDHGVRRYGAHGTSHQFVIGRAIEYLCAVSDRKVESVRIVSLHLGGGCSATASVGGVAIDTSMGMTPLEGLVMATRCGDIDASVPLHLIRRAAMTADEVDHLMNRQSGLKGLCGDADMRTVLQRRGLGDPQATLAIDIYIHRLVKAIGGYIAILGGIDGLVFTAGVGENASEIRRLATASLGYAGVELDEAKNASVRSKGDIVDVSTKASSASILVVPTDEELAIAMATKTVR